jgi:hypothetical protein
MTRNEINQYLCAILTTLRELDTDAAESTIYLAMGMDLPKYEQIRDIAIAAKLIVVQSHRISLTEAGKEMADRINSAMAGAK